MQPGSSFGPYRIHSLLGKGGMGRSLAGGGHEGQPPRRAQAAARRCRRRAAPPLPDRSAGGERAQPPNVAHIYEISDTTTQQYIAMEYVAGEGLDVRPVRGPLPMSEVLQTGTQVADALAEAHSRGIVHCDVKPANILVSDRGHVKVLDFGVARMSAGAGAATQSMTADV